MRNQNTYRTKLCTCVTLKEHYLDNVGVWQAGQYSAGLVSVTKDTRTPGPQVLDWLVGLISVKANMHYNILSYWSSLRAFQSQLSADVRLYTTEAEAGKSCLTTSLQYFNILQHSMELRRLNNILLCDSVINSKFPSVKQTRFTDNSDAAVLH